MTCPALQFSSMAEHPTLPDRGQFEAIATRAVDLLADCPYTPLLAVRDPLETDMRQTSAWLQDRISAEYGDEAFRSLTLRLTIRKVCRDVVTAHVSLVRTMVAR